MMRLTERHNRRVPIQFKLLKKPRALSVNHRKRRFETRGMDPNDEEEVRIRKCANGRCSRDLQTGDDALMLQRVVIGVMRPVPLEEPLLFHGDECFQEYVCNSEGPKLPKRIP